MNVRIKSNTEETKAGSDMTFKTPKGQTEQQPNAQRQTQERNSHKSTTKYKHIDKENKLLDITNR